MIKMTDQEKELNYLRLRLANLVAIIPTVKGWVGAKELYDRYIIERSELKKQIVALGLVKKMNKMIWHSFECMACFHAAGSKDTGVVFEVRCERDELPHANCPLCGVRCAVRGSWDADENGYGSSSDPNWSGRKG